MPLLRHPDKSGLLQDPTALNTRGRFYCISLAEYGIEIALLAKI